MSYLLYRDTLKPKPYWEEVGIYGGYRWIQFLEHDDIWISRKWEPQLVALMEMYGKNSKGCDLHCMKEIKDMLADNGILTDYTQSYINEPGYKHTSRSIVSYDRKYATDVLRIQDAEQENMSKLVRLLKQQDVVFVTGYSPLVDQMVRKGLIKKVVSSFSGYDCDFVELSKEDVAKSTKERLVFIPKENYELKGCVYNWANVINL